LETPEKFAALSALENTQAAAVYLDGLREIEMYLIS